MFNEDIDIHGKHAAYIKDLCANNSERQVFGRYIDMYMLGAVVGALYGKTAEADKGKDRARIYADAFNTEHVLCNEIFKLVILNDETKKWSDEEKINICFRYIVKSDDSGNSDDEENAMVKEAKELFDSYMLGGVELIYHWFTEEYPTDKDELIDNLFSMLNTQRELIEKMDKEAENEIFTPHFE